MKMFVKSSQLKLNKILAGIALVLGFGVTNQSFAYEYFTSINGCKVRQYSGEKLSKIDYTGSCQNGYANGQGNYTKYDSNNKITLTYKGQMKDGMPHGQGAIEWASGNRYDGGWQNGELHGKGIFTWANGSKYDGEYKDGKRHGLGKLTLVKGDGGIGDYHLGEWKGDMFVVQGEFNNGKHTLQCEPNRQACDKGRTIHAKKQAEIAQKQAEAEEKRRRAEQAQEPTLFFVNFDCASACNAEILNLSTPSGTFYNLINLGKSASVSRTQSSSFKGTYNFTVKLTTWGKTESQVCSGSFTKHDNAKQVDFLVHYYSCNISKMS